MTRRLLYHFFWNFYDYLGTHLLLGTSFSILVVMILGTTVPVAQRIGPGLAQIAILAVACVMLFLLVAGSLAGFFAFTSAAARDEAARVVHFREGARAGFRLYSKVLGLFLLVAIIIATNIAFYLRHAGASESPTLRLAFFTAAMVFLWVGLGAGAYFLSVFAAPAASPDVTSLRRYLRSCFILFAIAPMFHLIAAGLMLMILVLLVLSVVGLVFLLPAFATLSATAHVISTEYRNHLAQARDELGSGKPLGDYRRRAAELALEQEARQPQRTLKELLRPWDV
ncbi:MAG: hypothetical protein K1X53_00295 [Candidatus Sumerlaeaceae bacterium]|nr:hypothetical protein [Candidatus Sumerlaeaceae bacterium]